nr:oxygenase MpaB family protein [Flavihumibacter fluvii]
MIRKIWGNGDTILLIFAGSAAEFALNKAVDWLYFTGKIPKDPIGRLFSTVSYARKIIFATEEEAFATIDSINVIHSHVEHARGAKIPEWAFRDVLYMLIHYSIASFEILERPLSGNEKQAVFENFHKLGERMNIPGLPKDYKEWLTSYHHHLENDLEKSELSIDLFRQYKKHLGNFRYRILIESQKLIVPGTTAKLLGFQNGSALTALLPIYKLLRSIHADWLLKSFLLPKAYHDQIRQLDTGGKQRP